MIKTLSPFALGATLYMPATRSDILDVVSGTRFPELRSLVVCLEDAVAAIDVDSALANLRALLEYRCPGRARRIRSPAVRSAT